VETLEHSPELCIVASGPSRDIDLGHTVYKLSNGSYIYSQHLENDRVGRNLVFEWEGILEPASEITCFGAGFWALLCNLWTRFERQPEE
jgi:hypothetical protein